MQSANSCEFEAIWNVHADSKLRTVGSLRIIGQLRRMRVIRNGNTVLRYPFYKPTGPIRGSDKSTVETINDRDGSHDMTYLHPYGIYTGWALVKESSRCRCTMYNRCTLRIFLCNYYIQCNDSSWTNNTNSIDEILRNANLRIWWGAKECSRRTHVDMIDLETCWKMSLLSLSEASLQPRTSPV